MRISDWSSDVCSSDLLGWNDIALNAQVSAQSFYARHGFVPVGERFIEAGIEHQAMRRRIDRPQAIESSDAAVAATAAIIRQARRSLHVYSRELDPRSEEHTSELQSLMRISYAVFCLKKKKNQYHQLINKLRPQ